MTPSPASVAVLLGSTIDYAGTFPPAQLPLPDALKKAAEFRSKGTFPWLMGKLALPLSDIKTLNPRSFRQAGADGSAWLFTALGSAFTTWEELLKTWEWDFREIGHWNERGLFASLRSAVVAYDTKLPKLNAASEKTLKAALGKVAHLLPWRTEIFVELPKGENWIPELIHLAGWMSAWTHETHDSGLVPGIKVRTGGAAVPSAKELAEILCLTLGAGLRFKATQGLHSAITHGNEFGFINLFATLALIGSQGVSEFGIELAEKCLRCEDAKEFVFEENTFTWNGIQLSCEAIEAARRQHGACFGSCSVDEPDGSLREFLEGGRK